MWWKKLWFIRSTDLQTFRKSVVDKLNPFFPHSTILQFYNSAILITLLLCSIILNAQDFSIDKIQEAEAIKHKHRLTQKNIPPIQSYDVQSYQLDLTVNPDTLFIEGSVLIQFKSLEDSLRILQVHLADNMQFTEAKQNGNKLNYIHQNGVVSITLQSAILKDQLGSIELTYQGAPMSGGLGTFARDTIPGGSYTIWTLSQPYGASAWWPCKDDLYDKADTVRINISTPLNYKVASNGLIQSIDTAGSMHTYNYQTNYPIATYLIAIAVAEYDFYEEKYALGNDSLRMEHYLFPNQDLNSSTVATLPFLELFDSLFGEYPFINEKYGHASFTRGGGMEHQTMSFMGSYGGELIAHELAHQWFGDKVTCGSWQDLWLNEGFATYLTGLTYEFNVVHDSFYWPVVLDLWKKDVFRYPNDAVFRADTSNAVELFNPMAYQKGASLLHMIRWVIGDNAFFTAVRNYINDPNLEFSFSKTADLKKHFETTSGKNLDELFKDWFYGKGFPIYTTTWRQEASELNIEIEQTPSDPSVYFFNIPLPYQLHAASWDSTIILDPKFSGEGFNISISRNIDSITFDPEGWILAKQDVISSADEIRSNASASEEILLYPNPVENILQIKGDLSQYEYLHIYDINMRLLIEKKAAQYIDVQDLPEGKYILRLLSNKTENTISFIKQ